MKRTDPQFKLRLPPLLKEKVERAADTASRTLSNEIIYRLERSFGAEAQEETQGIPFAEILPDVMSEMEDRIKGACMKAIAEQFVFLETIMEAKSRTRE